MLHVTSDNDVRRKSRQIGDIEPVGNGNNTSSLSQPHNYTVSIIQ